jgi:hypothetical protein
MTPYADLVFSQENTPKDTKNLLIRNHVKGTDERDSVSRAIQRSELNQAFGLRWALRAIAPVTELLSLPIQDIRGSCNKALCDYSCYDRVEAERITREVRKQNLDCAIHSHKAARVNYTLDMASRNTSTSPTPHPSECGQ